MRINRIISVMLVLVLLLGMCGCNKATSPRDAVERFVTAMNNNDFRTAFAYIADYDSFGFSDKTEDIIKAVASSMKVEFVSESVGSSSATIEVKITTVDLRQVYKDAAATVIPEYYDDAVSGVPISEREIGDRIIDEVASRASDSYAPKVTTQLSLYLSTDKDGKWLIRLDNDAYYVITGYLDEANNLVTTGKIVEAITGGGYLEPVTPPQQTPTVSSSDV